MSGPSIDLEKPNAIGGLDRLVTNFALSAIAVVPTFLTCIAMPWRLTPLLDRDDPDGRMGMLLAPGAYFPLSLMVSFIVAAVLSTPETISYNGSYIGPDLAVSVQSAASNGEIWKIVAIIMPIYGVAVFLGLLGTILKPLAGHTWTLRISLRAAFYVMGTLVSWMLLTTAVVDLARISTKNNDIGTSIYPLVMIATAGAVVWMYTCFFRKIGAHPWIRSGAMGLAVLGLIFALFFAVDFLIRL